MHQPINIDIIILSYAKNNELKQLTEQTISSLRASEDPAQIQFNIVVIESNNHLKPYQFNHSLTIYPDTEFGYNKYLNIGLRATSNQYVCLCNNDLIFHKGWASEIWNVMNKHPLIKSANPFCDQFNYQTPITNNKQLVEGSTANLFKGILTGWCIFIKRELIDIIGYFDERFSFWYADRDYGKTILAHKIKHALVINSKVTHLGNKSHNAISKKTLQQFTHDQKAVYENKWGKDKTSYWQQAKNALNTLLNRQQIF